jgi:hypothetical protein
VNCWIVVGTAERADQSQVKVNKKDKHTGGSMLISGTLFSEEDLERRSFGVLLLE